MDARDLTEAVAELAEMGPLTKQKSEPNFNSHFAGDLLFLYFAFFAFCLRARYLPQIHSNRCRDIFLVTKRATL
jgi:hypothetical protein